MSTNQRRPKTYSPLHFPTRPRTTWAPTSVPTMGSHPGRSGLIRTATSALLDSLEESAKGHSNAIRSWSEVPGLKLRDLESLTALLTALTEFEIDHHPPEALVEVAQQCVQESKSVEGALECWRQRRLNEVEQSILKTWTLRAVAAERFAGTACAA